MLKVLQVFVETQIPHQRIIGGILFPAVAMPDPAAAADLDLCSFEEAVRHQKPRLESLLRSSDALHLRGFPVSTTADFDSAVTAFGYEELPYVGGAAPRTNIVGRVFTANESPPGQKIPFHHEMAQVPEYPSKLFFFCETEPGSGGETPIVLSHHVYGRMRERYPEFVDKLEEMGLIYNRVLGEGDDLSSPIGRGWQSTFLTKDKSVADRTGFAAVRVRCSGAGRISHRFLSIVESSRGEQRSKDAGGGVMLVDPTFNLQGDFGGTCISYAMEMFPSKIAKVVFVSATMPINGQNTLDMYSHQEVLVSGVSS